jgi:hypothetical protein
MEPKVLEEIRKHFKQEVIEFDWERIRKQPITLHSFRFEGKGERRGE